MHIYEAFQKEDILKFLKTVNPSIWKIDTRIDPESMRTIYILEWIE